MERKVLILLLFLLIATFCFSQKKEEDFDIVRASIYYPQSPKLRKIKIALLVQKYKFPEAWLEGAYHVPFLNVLGRVGLKKNFTAQFSLGTVIVTNQLNLGFRWNREFDDKFSFNIGYDIAGVYGALAQADFDTRVNAILHYPNFAFGYRYKDVAFTVKTEFSVVGHVNIKTGENVTSDATGFYNGFSVGIYMEQRLWKDHVVIFGLRNHYNKFNYIAWPAFSTFNRFDNTSEISLGLIL